VRSALGDTKCCDEIKVILGLSFKREG
jgi:hypothetical protein